MSINETISGNGESAEAFPTASVSDVTIGHGLGNVEIQSQSPASTEWFAIVKNRRGASSISTPDPAIKYRFVTTNETEDVAVYFGP